MIFVAKKSFNSKHFLNINAYIEEKTLKERIFFEFYLDYDRSRYIKIALNLVDLRAIIYAMKEVVKKGNTEFSKITQNDKTIKRLTITKWYLNATDGNLQISIGFENAYFFMAAADELLRLADEITSFMYEYQREKKSKALKRNWEYIIFKRLEMLTF